MIARNLALPLVILGIAVPALGQLTQDARFAILGSMIATEGAARMAMPLGKSGIELSENGLINKNKLQKELADNGRSIVPGRVVRITAIEFNDKSIEFEIDGGGTKKKGFLSNVQISLGGASNNAPEKESAPAKGSKITLTFATKLPQNLKADDLKNLLNPVLDFSKQSLARGSVDALPEEFQEAVKVKEARIGMDSNTVLLALGQPHDRQRQKNAEGVEQEDWIYRGRGLRHTFVTFEKDVVVSIREY